jgi:tungstate transport system substrate-binding protein
LIISTTTSLYETGFLDFLKTRFEANNPDINVSFISQGTGLAIQTAMRGDADMILVHDPARELQFLKGGYGVNRKIVAYNFFVIVGPTNDPAKIKGLAPLEAFKALKVAGEGGTALWISRGDDSGTHSKEKLLWKSAGFDVKDLRQESWYFEAGSGMTATLKMADEKMAYTLTDLGTYLMNYNKGNIGLAVLVEAGKDLLNVYSVIPSDPRHENLTKANFEASMKFIRFLVSDAGQELFDTYGKTEYGQSLFKPYVKLLKNDSSSNVASWIQQLAYFDGSECPLQFRYEAGDLYMATISLLQTVRRGNIHH